jgi:short-subunit dehydrogenase
MEIKGKVAIVTGASAGIGLATAKLLSKKGAKLALVSRSKEKLDLLAQELPGSIVVVADLSKIDEVKSMVKQVFEHFGRIDILVNNAGQGYDAPVEHTNPEVFRYLFDLDVAGPVAAMKEIIPLMREQGEGAIINISSGTALMQLPDMGPYSALKAALSQISLTAREELKEDNITVTVIYPYITLTDFEKNTIKDPLIHKEEETPEGHEAWAKADPPEHVAQLVVKAVENGEAKILAHDWMNQTNT